MTERRDRAKAIRTTGGPPVVLIASVSRLDGRILERTLKKRGWTPLRVDDAEDAARELGDGDDRRILVIDSGLLEMAHDPQWRVLRSHRPELRTVVRCLVPRPQALRETDGRMLEVDPDDVEGVCEAVLGMLS